MPMRWRWPPENSCGKRSSASVAQADLERQIGDPVAQLVAARDAVIDQRLGDDVADPQARVQRE